MRFTLHRFAKFTAAATFILICAGGLVTSTGSGLAVPDWPLSFGGLLPPMVGGVRFEHSHRLIAAFVGFLTLVLAIWAGRREPRRSVRLLSFAALATVALQALLGGLTVLFLLPTAISVAHAGLAELFFCAVVGVALLTSPGWMARLTATPAEANRSVSGRPGLLTLASATALAVYAQILLGAWVRHSGAGLAIPDFPLAFGRLIPPQFTTAIAIHFTHRAGALLVGLLVATVAWRVWSEDRERSELRNPAIAMLGLVALQIGLGALTIWTSRAVLPATAHLAGGALLLATSMVLVLRAAPRSGQAAS